MSDITTLMMAASGAGGGAETDPNFNQTVLLLHGDGTNGAQNNTFLDSSTNNFTITRNGNTTQGTFSPFSAEDGEWSNYFDGTGDYLSIADNAAFEFGSGDFTIEGWLYPNSLAGGLASIITKSDGTGGAYGPYLIGRNGSSIIVRMSSTGGSWDIANAVSFGTLALNQWQHFALVRNGNTITGYLNGVGTTIATTSSSLVDNANALLIGAIFASSSIQEFFNGYISNARIVKGRAVYTSDFTPPTSSLGATSGGEDPPQGTETSLLTCQSNRFVDNSSNAFAITVNGNPSVQPFSPFAPSAAYSASVNGGSASTDGAGDYLRVPNGSAFTFTGDFTVEGWVYSSFSAVTGNAGVVFIDTRTVYDAVNWSFGVFTYGGFVDNPQVALAGGVLASSINCVKNAWNHVALCRSGSTLRIFVNGAQGYSGTVSGTISTGAATNATILSGFDGTNYLSPSNVSGLRVVNGTALYTSAFTPPTAPPTAIANTSLLLNFTNAGIFDNTGKNNLETVGNAQIDTTTKKYGTGSLEFDGTGDYLSAVTNPNISLGSGDFTIEGWFYITADNTYNTLLSKYSGTASTSAFEIDIRTSLGELRSQWYYGSSSTTQTISFTFSTGTWYHIAYVRSSGTLKTYIDGAEEGSTSLSVTINDGTTNLQIGGNSVDARYLNGFIDDLRITKGVARYTANFTPPTAALPDL